jgi:GTPase SAR1 family protein
METYELALLGESSVGKTALQIQLAYESFAGTSCPQARYDVPLTDGLAPAVHFPQSRCA